MILYELPSGCSLRLLEEADADALFAVIDRNRDHLRRWLPWVDGTRDAASALEFVRMARRQAETNDGMQAAVVDGGAIIGVAGFHRVDWANRVTSIGYWLSADRQGRGTMTEAVATLVDVAFGVWRLNRVEIQAAVDNRRSRAIPERLGFREEGVRRQAERHADRYLDLVLYAMVAADWRRSPAASAAPSTPRASPPPPAHGGHGDAAPGRGWPSTVGE